MSELMELSSSMTLSFGCIISAYETLCMKPKLTLVFPSNIDRIFAIYQALYPDDSEYPDDSKDPKKWIDAKGATNGESPLYPFLKDEKQLWTSNDVKDWRKLGFAVPGNQYLDKKGRKWLESYLREQYYWYVRKYSPL